METLRQHTMKMRVEVDGHPTQIVEVKADRVMSACGCYSKLPALLGNYYPSYTVRSVKGSLLGTLSRTPSPLYDAVTETWITPGNLSSASAGFINSHKGYWPSCGTWKVAIYRGYGKRPMMTEARTFPGAVHLLAVLSKFNFRRPGDIKQK